MAQTLLGVLGVPPPRHYPGSNVQPVVVNNSRIANRVLTDKTPKSTLFGVKPPVSQNTQTVAVYELNAALEVFKQARPYGGSRLRHGQACWAAEMFLNEWESLAVAFEWTAEDIFDSPCARNNHGGGLAYWLGVDIVTALGPDHAVTETNRVFERN
jgi:hypothetical protein